MQLFFFLQSLKKKINIFSVSFFFPFGWHAQREKRSLKRVANTQPVCVQGPSVARAEKTVSSRTERRAAFRRQTTCTRGHPSGRAAEKPDGRNPTGSAAVSGPQIPGTGSSRWYSHIGIYFCLLLCSFSNLFHALAHARKHSRTRPRGRAFTSTLFVIAALEKRKIDRPRPDSERNTRGGLVPVRYACSEQHGKKKYVFTCNRPTISSGRSFPSALDPPLDVSRVRTPRHVSLCRSTLVPFLIPVTRPNTCSTPLTKFISQKQQLHVVFDYIVYWSGHWIEFGQTVIQETCFG